MSRVLAFFILLSIKTISMIFYRAHFHWITQRPENPWRRTKLFVFLNHTSLYEPLFIAALPYSFLWHLAGNLSVPAADITVNRPIVGRFWKLMIPNLGTVSRKKDSTWNQYLNSIKEESIIIITPEGRMKRPNGLDKFGKPMSVRGGVADIIEGLDQGGMTLCFSGGLHHVQAPGEYFPKFFKSIHMNLSYHDIKEYKSHFSRNSRERKIQIVNDLQTRLGRDCPDHSLNK